MTHNIVSPIACSRITLLSSIPSHTLKHKRDGGKYTTFELNTPGAAPVLLVVLHLPSKLYRTPDDQLLISTTIRQEIEEIETQCGHTNTLVIGDFNMNPFDKGMISVSAFNALPCARIAKNGSRTFDGRSYKYFYNPSWNLLGDRNDTPGTYFHRTPSGLSHYWNTLDQVIVRPSLSDAIDKQTFRALISAGGKSLISNDRLPDCSDHLPITLTLNLQQVKK
jgi:endonuclease/exonuclease/phosphatase family metal-dependent hydrolase